jgi:4-amino-4-deoxy-L-arabinose transferase-like glycosyltransferase
MADETGSGAQRLTLAALGLALAVLVLGSVYAIVVPAGEAPDEPAHLAYVDYLLAHRAVPPPLARPPYGDRYESYQAPLDYAASALGARALGIHSIGATFQPNPAFSFFVQGSRAYLPAPAGSPIVARIRELRSVHLLWAAATAVVVLVTCLQLAGGRLDLALAASAPFVLSPQFLFVGATVNNDGAVTCFAALALFAVVQMLDAERPSPRVALLAGTAAGLAPFGKVSGFLLLAPLAIAAVVLLRRRAYRPTILLLAAFGSLSALWIGLALWRFGTVFPPPPTGLREGRGAGRELLNPHWLGSLWVSFWGKLGWFNLRLPLVAYLFFAAPTALALTGSFGRVANPEERMRATRWRWVFLSTISANLVLVVVYLVRIDWQPQGRFLFPALPALAGLAALGLRGIADDSRWHRLLVRSFLPLLLISAIGMALLGLFVISHAYS